MAGIRFPSDDGTRFQSQSPDRVWDLHSVVSKDTRGSLYQNKAIGACS